jgi:hypothetical protein
VTVLIAVKQPVGECHYRVGACVAEHGLIRCFLGCAGCWGSNSSVESWQRQPQYVDWALEVGSRQLCC